MSALAIVVWILAFLLGCIMLLALIALLGLRRFDPFDSEIEYGCLDQSTREVRTDEPKYS